MAAGGRPESLTLLLAAFSAFAFAPAVPGFGRPGAYHALVAERRVERPIAVLRSDHDRALHRLYRLAAGGAEVARIAAGRSGYRRMVAPCIAGAVGARGVGAPELTLDARRADLVVTGWHPPRRAVGRRAALGGGAP